MRLIQFFISNCGELLQLTLEHLLLVLLSTGIAISIGVPVGILLTRKPSLSQPVLAVANIFQTIPSLALFGFLIPLPLLGGIGARTAVVALVLYSLLPIIRNTYTGITGVDSAIREAGIGMGMTDWQLLTRVELPLALSVIVAGIRIATVISVGTTTIAAAIGAGGLGTYIFRGLRNLDNNLILGGAIPAALLALAADFVLGWVERQFGGARTARKTSGRATIVIAAVAIVALCVTAYFAFSASRARNTIVVGAKDFTEQTILGELVAQAIERETGLKVERRFDLGGNLCHQALVAGEIDLYVEYTGTAFASILHHAPVSNAREVYEEVKREYAEKFDLEWTEPLGFNNTFAILVRGEDARRLGLKTISDAAKHTPQWRAGFGQDFMSRSDGYAGFARAYGLQFREAPREMDLSLTYRALVEHQVDLIAGNSTDGLISRLDLVQLEDDRHYFPPYEAAPVVRREVLERYPQLRDGLRKLGGKISEDDMRRMNSSSTASTATFVLLRKNSWTQAEVSDAEAPHRVPDRCAAVFISMVRVSSLLTQRE